LHLLFGIQKVTNFKAGIHYYFFFYHYIEVQHFLKNRGKVDHQAFFMGAEIEVIKNCLQLLHHEKNHFRRITVQQCLFNLSSSIFQSQSNSSFTDHFWYAALLVVLVPAVLAFVFGYFAFRSRIKGVYFSIITQALTYAFMLLFFRNDTGFGGNNGFTDFKRILGYPMAAPGTRIGLFIATGVALLGALLLARYVVTSKLGRVLTAIRDAESRVMFCGYSPLHYKLFVWTLSAVLCGIAGALYVPQVGIINPSEMSPANSIEIAIWAAVGGRGTLIGPIVGAFVVNGAKSWFTQAFPEYWLFFLGLLFILVTLFLPHGVIGVLRRRRAAAATNPR